jgi:hypothetical protein
LSRPSEGRYTKKNKKADTRGMLMGGLEMNGEG